MAQVPDYEWTFESGSAEPNKINVLLDHREPGGGPTPMGSGRTDQLRRYRKGNGTVQRTGLTTGNSADPGVEIAKAKEK